MPNIELRNKILHEVSTLPEDALVKLDDFINDLNKKGNEQVNPIMQLAGIWNNMDTESLDFLTTQLSERRSNNRRNNHE